MTRDTKKIKLILVLVFNFSVDWKNCQKNGKNILMKSYSCFVKEIYIKESDIIFENKYWQRHTRQMQTNIRQGS